MTAPRIPTPAQYLTEIMSVIGTGPADFARIIGKLVDHHYSYEHALANLERVLAEMVAAGRIERCDQPSQYVAGKFWAQWRLPASAPIDPSTAPDAGAVRGMMREGHISPEQFRSISISGKRKRK